MCRSEIYANICERNIVLTSRNSMKSPHLYQDSVAKPGLACLPLDKLRVCLPSLAFGFLAKGEILTIFGTFMIGQTVC